MEVTLRSGIKFSLAGLLVIGLVVGLFASPSSAAVTDLTEKTWNSWSNTIYYLAHLQGPEGQYEDITVYITAVDEYVLYINGTKVGEDNDWATVEEYKIDLEKTDDIVIGVEVTNHGLGNGNGLMVDIKAKSDWLGTTTLKRRTADVDGSGKKFECLWYYYAGDLPAANLYSGNWYDIGYNASKHETLLLDSSVKNELKQCILGDMGKIDYFPDPHIEVITGYPGDIDIGSTDGGGIALRRIEGENIALNRPAQEVNITDGDPTGTYYTFNSDPMDAFRYVDLERIYRVNRFALYTGNDNIDDWKTKSIRGFAVDISLDKFSWEEVNVIHDVGISNADNGGFDYQIVEFPDEWARYARFRITETRKDFPVIGEIMVFGVGYAYDGVYESDWIDFGDATKMKNLDSMSWTGSIPEGTSAYFQVKTSYSMPDGRLVESDWSPKSSSKTISIDSSEPAAMVKYKITMETQDIYKTPVIESISFNYAEDAADVPVVAADGSIFPNSVPMGVDTTFVYSIAYSLNSGSDIKKINLTTPDFTTIVGVVSNDGAGSDLTVANGGLVDINQTSPDVATIEFSTPLTDSDSSGSDSLYVTLRTKMLRNVHDFTASIYDSNNNNSSGGIGVWESTDNSWTVMTSTIINDLVTNVKAVPKVFTPNDDNTNDFTVIEFTLSKIPTDIKIKFYDTRGGLVTIKEYDNLEARDWRVPDNEKRGNAAAALNMPGYWDGTDEDGDLVPPGVYLYQVVADTDDGEKIESGTVVVGY